MEQSGDRLSVFKDFGDTRYTFNIVVGNDGNVRVSRVKQVDSPDGPDDVTTDTMVAIETNHVEWSPSYDRFPSVRVAEPLDGLLENVSATSSEFMRYALDDAPSWLSIDMRSGHLTGTPESQGDFLFDVVATGAASGERRYKTMVLPTADVRLRWPFEEGHDFRTTYTPTGQLDVYAGAFSPSSNKVVNTVPSGTPAGLALTSGGRIVASRRIGVGSVTIRGDVQKLDHDHWDQRTYLLWPADFLRTKTAPRARLLEIEQPEPGMHPTAFAESGATELQRLHASAKSGFTGRLDVDASGLSAVSRHRARSGGVLVDIAGSLRIRLLDIPQITASAKSSHSNYAVANVLDADPDTYWHSNFSVPEANQLPSWVTVDMGETVRVSGVRILPRRDHVNGIPNQVRIEVAQDAEGVGPWTQVASGEAYATVSGDSGPSDRPYRTFVFDAVAARHVRLVVESNITGLGHNASLARIQVLAERDGAGVETGDGPGPASHIVVEPTSFFPPTRGPTWSVLGVSFASGSHASGAYDPAPWTGLGALAPEAVPTGADRTITVGYAADTQDTRLLDADLSHLVVFDGPQPAHPVSTHSALAAHGIEIAPADSTRAGIMEADGTSEWGTVPREFEGLPFVEPGGSACVIVEARRNPLAVYSLAPAGSEPAPVAGGTWTDITGDVEARWAGGGVGDTVAVWRTEVQPETRVEISVRESDTLVFSREFARWSAETFKDVRPFYGKDGTVRQDMVLANIAAPDETAVFAGDTPDLVSPDGALVASTRTSPAKVDVTAQAWRDGIRQTLAVSIPLLNSESRELYSGGDGSAYAIWKPSDEANPPTFTTTDATGAFYMCHIANLQQGLLTGPWTVTAYGLTIVVRYKRGQATGRVFTFGDGKILANMSANGNVNLILDDGSPTRTELSAQHSTSTGNWVVYAFVAGPDWMAIYEDGQMIAQGAHTVTVADAVLPQLVLFGAPGIVCLEPYLSHARLYNHALSASEVLDATMSMPLLWSTPADLGSVARGDTYVQQRLQASVGASYAPVGEDPGIDAFQIRLVSDAKFANHLTETRAGVYFYKSEDGARFWEAARSGKYNRVYNGITRRVFRFIAGVTGATDQHVIWMYTLGAVDMQTRPFSNGQTEFLSTWFAFRDGVDTDLALDDPALPPSLALDAATGYLSGTPMVAGAQHVVVRATARSGDVADRTFTLAATQTPEFVRDALIGDVARDAPMTYDVDARFAESVEIVGGPGIDAFTITTESDDYNSAHESATKRGVYYIASAGDASVLDEAMKAGKYNRVYNSLTKRVFRAEYSPTTRDDRYFVYIYTLNNADMGSRPFTNSSTNFSSEWYMFRDGVDTDLVIEDTRLPPGLDIPLESDLANLDLETGKDGNLRHLRGSPLVAGAQEVTVRAHSRSGDTRDRTFVVNAQQLPEFIASGDIGEVSRGTALIDPRDVDARFAETVQTVGGPGIDKYTMRFTKEDTPMLSQEKFSGIVNESLADVRTWFETATLVNWTGRVDKIEKGDEGSNYSYRWRGYVTPKETGQYKFTTESDDGSWIFLDGTMIVDNGGLHGVVRVDSAVQNLVAGTRYHLDIMYYEKESAALARVKYSFGSSVVDTMNLSTIFDATQSELVLDSADAQNEAFARALRAGAFNRIYNASSRRVFAIEPSPRSGHGDMVLKMGHALYSDSTTGRNRIVNESRRLIMQDDGNLVLYNSTGATWALNSQGVTDRGPGPWRAVMQTQGNLVVYDSTGTARWSSGAFDGEGPEYELRIGVGDTHSFAIFKDGAQYWSSDGATQRQTHRCTLSTFTAVDMDAKPFGHAPDEDFDVWVFKDGVDEDLVVDDTNVPLGVDVPTVKDMVNGHEEDPEFRRVTGTPLCAGPQSVVVHATTRSGGTADRRFEWTATQVPQWHEVADMGTVGRASAVERDVSARFGETHQVVGGPGIDRFTIQVNRTAPYDGQLQDDSVALYYERDADGNALHSKLVSGEVNRVYNSITGRVFAAQSSPTQTNDNVIVLGTFGAQDVKAYASPFAPLESTGAFTCEWYAFKDGVDTDMRVEVVEIPPGLELDRSGQTLRGTPLVAGSQSVTMRATTASGHTAEREFTLQATQAPEWRLAADLGDATRGVSFEADVSARFGEVHEVVDGGPGIDTYRVQIHRDDYTGYSSFYEDTRVDLLLRQNIDENIAFFHDHRRGKFNRAYTPDTKRVYALSNRASFKTSGGTWWWRLTVSTFGATDMKSRPFTNGNTDYWTTFYVFKDGVDEDLVVPEVRIPLGMTLDPSSQTLSGAPLTSGPQAVAIRSTTRSGDTADRTFTFNARQVPEFLTDADLGSMDRLASFTSVSFHAKFGKEHTIALSSDRITVYAINPYNTGYERNFNAEGTQCDITWRKDVDDGASLENAVSSGAVDRIYNAKTKRVFKIVSARQLSTQFSIGTIQTFTRTDLASNPWSTGDYGEIGTGTSDTPTLNWYGFKSYGEVEAELDLHSASYGSANDGLVPGLGINDVWGHISGTPKISGTHTMTVTATSASGDTATRAFTLTVNQPPVFDTARSADFGTLRRGGDLPNNYDNSTLRDYSLDCSAAYAKSYQAVAGPGFQTYQIKVHRDEFSGESETSTDLVIYNDLDIGALQTDLAAGKYNRVYTIGSNGQRRVFKIRNTGDYSSWKRCRVNTFNKTDMYSRPFTGAVTNIVMTFVVFKDGVFDDLDLESDHIVPGMSLNSATGALTGKPLVPLDLNENQSITVRATSHTGQSVDRTFTMAIRYLVHASDWAGSSNHPNNVLKPDGIWHNNFNNPSPMPQWIELDLGSTDAVNSMTITPRQDMRNGVPHEYRIEARNQYGDAFTTLLDDVAWAQTSATGDALPAMTFTFASPQSYMHYRFLIDSNVTSHATHGTMQHWRVNFA